MTNPVGPYGAPPAPSAMAPQPPGRPWFKKKRFIVPSALVALAVLGGVLSGGSESAQAPPAVSTTGAPAPTDSSTTTTEPTADPAENATPESKPAQADKTPSVEPEAETATPSPTPTQETTEPDVALDPYEVRYGTFEAFTESGSGDSVITVPEGHEAGLITATHEGSSNFIMQGLDDEYEVIDLYMNEIGAYSGTVDWGLSSYRDAPSLLQISANGAWTVTLSPITSAPTGGRVLTGTGDTVVKHEGEKALAPVTHNGNSNFIVYQTDGTRPNLLLNEIGFYQGTIPVKAGPSLIIVKADGDWSITLE